MAIQLHQEVRSLRERFRKLRIREGENTNPSEQVYWLTQATIDSERTLNTQLSHKLREEKLKKENAERDKRLSAIATTTAATQRQPVPPSYSYPVATGQPAFPNMAQYMNNPAYQTYYQQYAAAMATMTPADLQARAAIYAQTLRYPYAPAYPYGQYVAAPGVQFPPPNVFPPAFYSPETMSNPATAASTPPSSATPLTPAGQPQPYTPPNSAIPLTLPAAALETLKASGIVPVSSQNLPSAGQPQPAVVLLSMSPDNSVANVTINLSLLLPEQRGKLSGVLQSLVKGNAAVALSG
ncbi:hypothetical protein FRB94_008832 [Tulasnella sp. JGI-2019a]|nr:hypothetical protein FRB94_008832 [Tulasnella sp. JGI-2019a]